MCQTLLTIHRAHNWLGDFQPEERLWLMPHFLYFLRRQTIFTVSLCWANKSWTFLWVLEGSGVPGTYPHTYHMHMISVCIWVNSAGFTHQMEEEKLCSVACCHDHRSRKTSPFSSVLLSLIYSPSDVLVSVIRSFLSFTPVSKTPTLHLLHPAHVSTPAASPADRLDWWFSLRLLKTWPWERKPVYSPNSCIAHCVPVT